MYVWFICIQQSFVYKNLLVFFARYSQPRELISSVSGIVVSIAAFQAVDPGSIPG